MNQEIHETEPQKYAEWNMMSDDRLALFESGQAWILTDTVESVEP
jgi:hypothetical protein